MNRQTARQEIATMLRDAEYDFEELREILGLPVKVLEDHLRHLEKSLRHRDGRLVVRPARCPECGFQLRLREGRFATPGRCPECRNERLEPVRLHVVGEG